MQIPASRYLLVCTNLVNQLLSVSLPTKLDEGICRRDLFGGVLITNCLTRCLALNNRSEVIRLALSVLALKLGLARILFTVILGGLRLWTKYKDIIVCPLTCHRGMTSHIVARLVTCTIGCVLDDFTL